MADYTTIYFLFLLWQNANCCVLVNEDTYKTSSGSAVFEKICSIKVKGRDDKIKVLSLPLSLSPSLPLSLSPSLPLSLSRALSLSTPCTLPCTPCTLHPTPYTLHPTPSTLHPTPYTLHPATTPCTLHPTSSILHPTHHTPYTLNSIP
jgi:hypothetical protein